MRGIFLLLYRPGGVRDNFVPQSLVMLEPVVGREDLLQSFQEGGALVGLLGVHGDDGRDAFAAGGVPGQAFFLEPEGAAEGVSSQPYTPTKLEWICTEANISMACIDFGEKDYSLLFIPIHYEDAALLLVQHRVDASQNGVKASIISAENSFWQIAKSRHWDSWIKLKVQIIKLPL